MGGSSDIYACINHVPMTHETGTAETTTRSTATGAAGRKRQLLFAGGIVAAFLLVGIGVGLAGRFGLVYIIGLFDAGQNPTANQYVGIVFLVTIFVLLMVGTLMSGVAGLMTGLSFRRRLTAATIGGAASLVGFFVMTFPALFIMVSILGGGGGGGGGGGPSLPTSAILKTGGAAGIVGALTGYLGSVIGN